MGKEVHCYSVPDYASAALAADVEDIFAQSAAARAGRELFSRSASDQ